MAIISAYGRPFAVAAMFKLLQDCMAYLQPQLLRIFLAYIATYQSYYVTAKSGGPTAIEGFAIVIVMVGYVYQSIWEIKKLTGNNSLLPR
jgi:ATP-binding cassette, subfamily C (CFTR/MRP), member 1